MAKTYDQITPDLAAFIEKQPLFFVASAPLSASGHVNLSPKGLDSLRILSPTRVAYVDVTGSGNETAAHLLENGRITFMFCAFEGPPNILRLYGAGHSVQPADPAWAELSQRFTLYPGTRQIIVADITRVQTSCGYGVPLMDLVGQRETMVRWAESLGEETLAIKRQEHNARSLDGLPTPLAPTERD